MFDRSVRPTKPVWDLFVRIFHWTVVVGFFVAYFTEGEPLLLHIWAGYVVAAAVVLRIFWGFVGTPHARFSDFVFPLKRVIAHAVEEVRFRGKRYIGHNPAGGMMIILLLLMLLATTTTGGVLLALDKGQGPFSGFITQVEKPVAALPEDRGEHEHGAESPIVSAAEEVHEVFANLTLFLVFLHVGGVVVASLAHRENLVASMIHGRKRPLS